MLYVCLMGGVVLLLAYLCTRGSNPTILNQKAVLLITAHPDDECMFFGPTITALTESGCQVYILCLSTGNWYGIGEKRKHEFFKSCDALGLNRDHCEIVDDDKLPDSPTIKWDEDYIVTVIDRHLINKNITALLTFDSYGVSGHHNHISVYESVLKYHNPALTKYKLTSVSIVRKYLSIVDIIIANMLGEKIILTPIPDFVRPYRAMFQHRSQLMWFRYLYLLFSRYMFMNTLEVM